MSRYVTHTIQHLAILVSIMSMYIKASYQKTNLMIKKLFM